MTQLELAEKKGITDKAISKWERDLSCPDVTSFPHLAEVLNVTVDELMQSKSEAAPKGNINAIINLLFKSVGMAMGVAVVVLSALNSLEADTGITMLGIGLACIAISSLQGVEQ